MLQINKKEQEEPYILVDASHAMTITGVNKDGDYIVSTWGEKYVLDSDSVDSWFGLNVISFEEGDDDDE